MHCEFCLRWQCVDASELELEENASEDDEALHTRYDCPWADQVVPTEEFQRYVPHVDLERGANEVLCFHGAG